MKSHWKSAVRESGEHCAMQIQNQNFFKYLRFLSKIGAILMVFSIVFSLTSCELDDGVDPDDTDPVSIFLGRWMVSDNELKINYEVTIQRNPSNTSEVLLQNFAGSGSTATALVTGKTLTLISPVIGNNWQISGSGAYKNASRMEFNYRLTIGGSMENRFAMFTR